MGRNLDDVIAGLPRDRQTKIAELTAQKMAEMGAAKTFGEFRKANGMTQAQVAKGLGVNQNAISQMEKRSDTSVSTLRRFVKAFELDLELSVVAKNGARIDLPNFLRGLEAEVKAETYSERRSPAIATASKGVARAVAAKREMAASGKREPKARAPERQLTVAAGKAPKRTKG